MMLRNSTFFASRSYLDKSKLIRARRVSKIYNVNGKNFPPIPCLLSLLNDIVSKMNALMRLLIIDKILDFLRAPHIDRCQCHCRVVGALTSECQSLTLRQDWRLPRVGFGGLLTMFTRATRCSQN